MCSKLTMKVSIFTSAKHSARSPNVIPIEQTEKCGLNGEGCKSDH